MYSPRFWSTAPPVQASVIAPGRSPPWASGIGLGNTLEIVPSTAIVDQVESARFRNQDGADPGGPSSCPSSHVVLTEVPPSTATAGGGHGVAANVSAGSIAPASDVSAMKDRRFITSNLPTNLLMPADDLGSGRWAINILFRNQGNPSFPADTGT
jgi:hypothetical protein